MDTLSREATLQFSFVLPPLSGERGFIFGRTLSSMETIITSEYNVLVSLFKNVKNQLACSYSSTTSLSGNKIHKDLINVV